MPFINLSQRGGALRAPSPLGCRRLALVFSLIAFFVLALSHTPQLLADGELARARDARVLFFQGDKPKARENWLALIKTFEDAASVQPRAHYRALANLEGAELSLQSYYRFKNQTDATRSERLARSILKDCPRCQASPGALLVLGRALAAKGRKDDAYRELMKVELSHPGSAEVEEARFLMSSLRAGENPPSYPVNAPLDKTSLKPQETETIPKTQVTSSTTSPKDPPPKSSIPSTPTPVQRTLVTPVEAPIKAPSPRKDGLAQVYAYTLTDLGDYSVVTAWLDQVTPYVYNLVPPLRSGGSYRVYVDFRDARQAPGLSARLKNSTKLVSLVKANQYDSKTVRLVADLKEPYPYTPTFLDNPPRLELLVSNDPSIMPPREADAQPVPRSPKASVKPARGPSDSLARQLGLKINRVVIDPGHGGKDSGASGFGYKEKDIALKTAKLLGSKIKSRLGLDVVLTRDTDKFITLERRSKIVTDSKGDLFISIHANSNSIVSVEGLETYILNFGTDPSAMTVAARENASSQKSMSELSGLLDKLTKNTKVAESRVLAKSIHQGALSALRSKYKVRDLGVKEALFVVLLNTDVPAVLIEIGFLSNANESKRLSDDKYLDLLTDGMVDGLAAYIAGLPH
jgi:N-acetylmuramoyl-L-alanine amidase